MRPVDRGTAPAVYARYQDAAADLQVRLGELLGLDKTPGAPGREPSSSDRRWEGQTMTLQELLEAINEHLEIYPQDRDLIVMVGTERESARLTLEPQWYAEEGYVRLDGHISEPIYRLIPKDRT